MIDFLRKIFSSSSSQSEVGDKREKTNYRKEINHKGNYHKEVTLEERQEEKQNKKGINSQKKDNEVLFLLVPANSKQVDVSGHLVEQFHENTQGESTVYIMLGAINYSKINENGDPLVGTIGTKDMSREDYEMLMHTAQTNLDKLEYEFSLMDTNNDLNIDFDVLTLGISAFSSETILSKVHMMKAQKMLNSDSIIVSIARSGHIFICSNNLTEEQRKKFIRLHAYVLIDESEFEILTEDLFVLKNGNIESIMSLPSLKDLVNKIDS